MVACGIAEIALSNRVAGGINDANTTSGLL